MLSLAKAITLGIIAQSLFLGTPSVNCLNTGQDRVLSRDDGEYPTMLGELTHEPYEHQNNTLSTRKLLQTSGPNGPWTPTQKMTAGDGAAGDDFGWSIALDDTTLVVGAPSFDGNSFGSAYVFEKSDATGISWTLSAKLTAGDGASDDHFGESISLDGNTLAVGAHFDDDRGSGSGSVYVFEKSNVPGTPWTQSTKLTAKDGAANDDFGWIVSLEGSTLAVGAPTYYGNGSGSVYVFDKPDVPGMPWTQSTKLTAGDGAAGDYFGYSIALDGITLAVGAPSFDSSSSGSIYVYEKSNVPEIPWTFSAKLTPGDGAAGDWFGSFIALDGTTLVVGAPGDDDRGSDSGSVYVYEKSIVPGTPWTQTAKLTARDGAADDQFGWSIALNGTTLVVGACFDDDLGSDSGSVYVFEKSNVPGIPWIQSTRLTAGDGAAHDNFGWFVALEGSTLAVGAPFDDDVGSESGSVYVFESKALLPPPPPPSPRPPPPPPTSSVDRVHVPSLPNTLGSILTCILVRATFH